MWICCCYPLTSVATKFKIEYWDPADKARHDLRPVTPSDSNPGKTISAARANVSAFAATLLERIIWVPDDRENVVRIIFLDLQEGASAAGSPLYFLPPWSSPLSHYVPILLIRARPDLYPPDLYDLGFPAGVQLYHSRNAGPLLDFRIPSQRSYSETESPIYNLMLSVILHEFVHGLGMVSLYNCLQPYRHAMTPYDTHVRDQERPLRDLSEMTLEECQKVVRPLMRSVWRGTSTSAAAGRILKSGQVNGDVSIGDSTLNIVNDLSHLSNAVSPLQLMHSSSRGRVSLGIAAYILSDIGYGPVVDSIVFIEDTQDNILRIGVATIVPPEFTDTVENLRVNIHLPEGLSVDSASTSPAVCNLKTTPVVCDYTTFAGYSILEFQLSGTDGSYEIKADVDHRALHVDPRPLNNFDTVTFVPSRDVDVHDER